MEDAADRPPFPASELVESGPLAEVELSSRRPSLFVSHAFSRLDLRFQGSGQVPPIEIVSGFEWLALGARYVAVQEPLMQQDPHRGWAPVGGVHSAALLIGPSEAGQLEFPPDVGTEEGILLCAYPTFLSLTACGGAVATARVAVEDLLTPPEASARRREGAVAA